MIKIGDWNFELSINQLSSGEKIVSLEPLAAQVLDYLAARPNSVVSTDELAEKLWPRRFVGDNPIYRVITDLRQALGDDARTPRYIQTIRKRGYRLIAPVMSVERSVEPVAAIPLTTTPNKEKPASNRYKWGLGIAATLAILVVGGMLLRPASPTEFAELEYSDPIGFVRQFAAEGRYSEAEQRITKALSRLESSGRAGTAHYARTLTAFGTLEFRRQRIARSAELYQQALDLYRRTLGPKHLQTGFLLSHLANVRIWEGNYVAGESLLREAAEILRATVPEQHPDRILVDAKLASTLLLNGRAAEARPLIEQNFRRHEATYGARSVNLIEPLWSLAELNRLETHFSAAIRFAADALSISRERHGDFHQATAQSHEKLALALWKGDRAEEAEAMLRQAARIYRQILPQDNLYLCSTEYFLGEVLWAQGRIAESKAQVEASMARLQRLKAARWRIARSRSLLGEMLATEGHLDLARQYLEDSYKELSEAQGLQFDMKALARARLERFRAKYGSTDTSEPKIAG